MSNAKEGVKSDSAFSEFSASFLEKAWELRWGLKLAYIVLVFDAALAMYVKKNLVSLAVTPREAWEHFGVILTAVAVFSLLVSFVLPFTSGFVKVAGTVIPWHWLDSDRDDMPGVGYVSLHQLKEHAVRENNDFAWSIYKEAERDYLQAEAQRDEIGRLVFGLFLLLVLNVVLGKTSAVETIGLFVSGQIGGAGWVALVFVVLSVIRMTWWGPWRGRIAYYPPLYDELSRKRAKARL